MGSDGISMDDPSEEMDLTPGARRKETRILVVEVSSSEFDAGSEVSIFVFGCVVWMDVVMAVG